LKLSEGIDYHERLGSLERSISVIEVQHLTKRYGKVTAVDDVTFRVERGEILGFLGPNGAGKTTTMRVLTGYIPATSGRAVVAGFDVFEQPLEAKRRTGYLPETPPLYPEMTVREYLGFVARIKGVPSGERKARIDLSMEKARVTDMAGRHCGKLSKGYRQRVGLAQALLHNPDVLILDEPTAGLDPKQIIEVRNLIKGFGGDHTVILSTHILPEVSMTCERVVIINQGKIVAVDTPGNLTNQLRGGERIELELRGPVDSLQSLLTPIPHVKSIMVGAPHEGHHSVAVDTDGTQEIRHIIARKVIESGFELYQLKTQSMSLEEIFLQLTTKEEAA